MLNVYLTRFSAFVSNELCRQEDPEKILGEEVEIRCRSSCHLSGSSATLQNAAPFIHHCTAGPEHAASTWGPSDLNMRAAEIPRWLADLAHILQYYW